MLLPLTNHNLVGFSCLQKGQGPPGREPVFSEEQRKQMMAYAYRKQEELKVFNSI